MRHRLLALLALLPFAAAAQNVESQPFPGVRLVERRADGQRMFVAVVDLCHAGIAARGTRPDERGATVPDWAARTGVQLAVNGNFYNPGNLAEIDGWAAGDGQRWGGADHGYVSAIAFGPGRVDTWPHEEELGHFWGEWMQQIVSGHPTLVVDGVVRDNQGDGALCPRHPRTAVGFSADWHTMILAVVDGRDGGAAVGMRCDELANLMLFVGAHNAVNLDGGGSSTLWVQGRGVVNRPSDGRARTVSTHLGIYARGEGAPAHCMQPEPPCDVNPGHRGCDGNFLVSCHHTQLERGDCGAFGLTCSEVGGPVRCVDPRCVGGDGSRCVSDTVIGECRGDVFSEGDCGMFGASCAADAAGAFCVHLFCGGEPDAVACADEVVLRTCRRGQLEETPCGEGTVCRDGACRDPAAPDPDAGPARDAASIRDAASEGPLGDARVVSDAAIDARGPAPGSNDGDVAPRDAVASRDGARDDARAADSAAPYGVHAEGGCTSVPGAPGGLVPLLLITALARRRRASPRPRAGARAPAAGSGRGRGPAAAAGA